MEHNVSQLLHAFSRQKSQCFHSSIMQLQANVMDVDITFAGDMNDVRG